MKKNGKSLFLSQNIPKFAADFGIKPLFKRAERPIARAISWVHTRERRLNINNLKLSE